METGICGRGGSEDALGDDEDVSVGCGGATGTNGSCGMDGGGANGGGPDGTVGVDL